MWKLTDEGNNKTRHNKVSYLNTHLLAGSHYTFSVDCKNAYYIYIRISHESTYMMAVITSPKTSNTMYKEQVCSYKNHNKITSLDFAKLRNSITLFDARKICNNTRHWAY